MSSSGSDSDVEVSVGKLTLRDVKHFALIEKRKPKSRSQSLNFTPNAMLDVHESQEDVFGASKSDLKEIRTTNEWERNSINKSTRDNSICEINASEESIAGTSSAYKRYTSEEESNHSSPAKSNSYQSAAEFKGGYGAEEDLINFSTYSYQVQPSTSYEQIITDEEEDTNESVSNNIDLKNNSLHIKVEKNDTAYFTCNESLQSKASQSKAVMNESVIVISDEEDEQEEKCIEEESRELEISNQYNGSDFIVVLSDDDNDEIIDESLNEASHTSFEANEEMEDNPLDCTFDRIERLLNSEENATNVAEIKDIIPGKEEPERQYLTPAKLAPHSIKNDASANLKSGIPISTSKIPTRQTTIEKNLFKTPQTPININKRKLKPLNTVSPVAMYIKYSPRPVPIRQETNSTKAQNGIKKGLFTYVDIELPKIFYKPSSLQVTTTDVKMKLPPSYAKLIMNPLVHKHERRVAQTMGAEMTSTVLAELEKNPYNKLDESNVNVSFWINKEAYEEAQAL